eukprot:1159929-Pelagomonas_calceolata.AAC.17
MKQVFLHVGSPLTYLHNRVIATHKLTCTQEVSKPPGLWKSSVPRVLPNLTCSKLGGGGNMSEHSYGTLWMHFTPVLWKPSTQKSPGAIKSLQVLGDLEDIRVDG